MLSKLCNTVDLPLIAILPHEFRLKGRLADVSLSELRFLKNHQNFDISKKKVSDLLPKDILIIYPSLKLMANLHPGVRAGLFLLFAEPRANCWHYMLIAILTYRKYRAILSSDIVLNRVLPNSLLFNLGGCWVQDWRELDFKKTKMLSLIASAKNKLKGHKLRHRVADWLRIHYPSADLFGSGYLAISNKSLGLASYRYSVVIENSSENGYFTEKLIDAFICRAIPIYWGCPDIEKYFDIHGMVIVNSFEEIKFAISEISECDYESRINWVEINQKLAIKYLNYQENAANEILKLNINI